MIAVFGLSLVLAGWSNVSALDLGQNITIFDQSEDPSYWHTGVGQGREDQEIEPNSAPGQKWDLEGMFIKGAELSMVAGFTFPMGPDGVESGDIFLAVGEKPVFGDGTPGGGGNQIINNIFGYDYVLDLDFATMTYDVVAIDANTKVRNTTYSTNSVSNPWRYESGGVTIAENISFIYDPGYTDAEVGFLGDESWRTNTHNALSGFELGFLGINTEFWAHFTIQCGNDNLMAQGIVTPEPTTLLLLGSGLLGVVALGRRKRFSK